MEMKYKILIVEDDNYINKILSDMLRDNGYEVQSAYSGTEALLYLKDDSWNIVLLDLMLPGKTGEEVLCEIRKKQNMPIIIISAKDDFNTKIETLRAGADDFICKPFNMDEVLARIECNLRRYVMGRVIDEKGNFLTHKDIELNKDSREVKINNHKIELTMREFNILELLMDNPKKVFSKINLFESVWGEDYIGDDNTLSVHVSNLRNKIAKYGNEKEYIKTVWGIGYKLSE
ncbi:response regulator transcription factor [Oceanirhabdus sp. W0125-5]|uniref:response regulator transcription factor n=1 Tax=Oceanirhabdus sp. W0125-5 TaxID=2999116 RepID=UPI0022F2B200|nr:response regulator transcription factor [Oceanirhabdus sp. W0125-5]WBW97421.1 response regulator transcription factor [Oceanirhabdus sp. W0125-5]